MLQLLMYYVMYLIVFMLNEPLSKSESESEFIASAWSRALLSYK